MTQHIVYLHGFLSSPQSEKAQATKSFMAAHFPHIALHCPQLPNYPDQARDFLRDFVPSLSGDRLGFIGSSMGGFLSTWLAQHFSGKAVLINPAVAPYRLMQSLLGDHQNPYTQEYFRLESKHVDVLESMHMDGPSRPRDFWVLLQKGDETLDYRDAEAFYQDSKLTIEEGGDHSFVGYQNYLPEIISYLLNE